jgi:hypothetical protein
MKARTRGLAGGASGGKRPRGAESGRALRIFGPGRLAARSAAAAPDGRFRFAGASGSDDATFGVNAA